MTFSHPLQELTYRMCSIRNWFYNFSLLLF